MMHCLHDKTPACDCNPMFQACSLCGYSKREVQRRDRGTTLKELCADRYIFKTQGRPRSHVGKLRNIR